MGTYIFVTTNKIQPFHGLSPSNYNWWSIEGTAVLNSKANTPDAKKVQLKTKNIQKKVLAFSFI